MAVTHSLTAYRCNFSYMERKNPIDTFEMKEAIKKGESPDYKLTEFIHDYISAVSLLSIGQNANRAIQLTKIASSKKLKGNVTRIHIQPQAGKHGEPVTVFEKATSQLHRFGKDDPALYDYNVFFYENNGDVIAIFYRRGTSGCKTVFYETANDVLRTKGIKLEMNLIVPLNQTYNLESATLSKLGIQWLAPKKKSRDIADDIGGEDAFEKKEKWIQKLIIDLKPTQNNWIKNIIDRFTSGQIDKNTAFAEIKTKCVIPDNIDNYNDAFIQYQIGGSKLVTVHFGEIENQIGAYDITSTLDNYDLINSLSKCADKYYEQLPEEIT